MGIRVFHKDNHFGCFVAIPIVYIVSIHVYYYLFSKVIIRKGMHLISHQFEGKQYNHGIWRIGKMVGYTSRGAGVSGIPLRFNCIAEVTIITLFRSKELQ